MNRTPIAIIKGRFCAAVEQLAMADLSSFAPAEPEPPRERALRAAAEWLTDLPDPESLPEELARSVAGTKSWLPELREADCRDRTVGLFICGVLQTAILATQYETAERIGTAQRLATAPQEGEAH